MNSNNWLSFPLSPTHSSLPSHLQTTPHSSHHHHHQFSLGLVNESSLDNPFHTHDWNLISSNHNGGEVPKVADFLGVTKTDHHHHHQETGQSDVAAFNDDDDSSDYLFPANNTNSSHHLLLPLHQNLNTPEHEDDSQQNINYHGLLDLGGPPVAAADHHHHHHNAATSSTLQSLTLSMGSSGNGPKGPSTACETSADTGALSVVSNAADAAPRRTLDTFGQRTSIYRGVTRHRWTGRYEAHLWDNSCRREGQSRKGRQVYLGGYDKEEKAARAYDMAALKYWGTSTTTNFPISHYEKELEEMKHMTRQEFVASIRRKSSGFSRGASMYRGVTRHHQHGRWQARIGRVAGNKDLYLGTFSTEEEAAEAYDIAAIKFRGLNAVTNFDMNRYDVKSILESNTLPIGGGAARRLKEAHAIETSRKRDELIALGTSPSACFQYGGGLSSSSSSSSSSLSSRLHPYAIPLIDHLHQPLLQQDQPLLTLQNIPAAELAGHQYHQDPLTQLQLHQQQAAAATNFLNNPYYNNNNNNNNNHFYGLHSTTGAASNNSAWLHGGLISMGSSSTSVVEAHNGGPAGYFGSGIVGLGGAANPTGLPVVGSADELALVKVDYDMPPPSASGSTNYGAWLAGDSSSVQGSNPGIFTMWND